MRGSYEDSVKNEDGYGGGAEDGRVGSLVSRCEYG